VSGRLTVLSGPSGVGKGSVIAAVRRRYPQVWLSVSVTTRAPRPGETDGVEYHFVDQSRYDELVAAGELLEHATYAGHCYGTPLQPVLDKIAAGVPALLEIELQGARQVKAAMPEAHLVFLSPPTFDELARRLTDRGTEQGVRVRARLDLARIELAAEDEFEAVIINQDVEQAADALVALLGVQG
jgi:guanylate kinase